MIQLIDPFFASKLRAMQLNVPQNIYCVNWASRATSLVFSDAVACDTKNELEFSLYFIDVILIQNEIDFRTDLSA